MSNEEGNKDSVHDYEVKKTVILSNLNQKYYKQQILEWNASVFDNAAYFITKVLRHRMQNIICAELNCFVRA